MKLFLLKWELNLRKKRKEKEKQNKTILFQQENWRNLTLEASWFLIMLLLMIKFGVVLGVRLLQACGL